MEYYRWIMKDDYGEKELEKMQRHAETFIVCCVVGFIVICLLGAL